MSKPLPENSVRDALERTATMVGGWNALVGKINTSREGMRVWANNNEVPSKKAKTIEELTEGKVNRKELNEVFQ